MNAKQSCSACCGIFNLDLDDGARRAWIETNTHDFLALDLAHSENIVAFRKAREAATLPLRKRDDIYVCPFVGFVKTQPRLAGCLLHPTGSPHPQIGLWPHPQNFSFYGEGICLSYDCLAKERRAYSPAFFRWAEKASLFAYSRLASDHTLHRALGRINFGNNDLNDFFDLLAKLYADYNIVTTSFEDIEKEIPTTIETLCAFLAQRISNPTVETRLVASLQGS